MALHSNLKVIPSVPSVWLSGHHLHCESDQCHEAVM